MATRKWSDVKRERLSPERIAEIKAEAEQEVLEMNLQALRKRLGLTQEQLAARLQLAQSQLSRIERREDHLTSTLARYIQALGGQLEIVAIVDGQRIKLQGI